LIRELPALMPESRIKPAKPTLDKLRVGESGHVYAGSIWVKPDRTVFVSKDTKLLSREEGITVRITRKEDGYHVNLDGYNSKWEVLDGGWLHLTERYGNELLEPIQSVEE
jgi:hypothetical protein